MLKQIKTSFIKCVKLFDPTLPDYLKDLSYARILKRKLYQLNWKPLRRASNQLLDNGACQYKNKLYIFGGFNDDNTVYSLVNILNLETGHWEEPFDMPKDMAHTHHGLAFDGERYLYETAGQFGDACRPATNRCFVLDFQTREWLDFPSLPVPRYAPIAQLWNGRLHVAGGSKEDRGSTAVDHWSIAVKDGKALEEEWRREVDIPRGGPHRATAVLNGMLYVFGGQEGDYSAEPGDSCYRCTDKYFDEVVFPDVYRLKKGARRWERMADMAEQVSHTEFSKIQFGSKIVLIGGARLREQDSKLHELSDAIQMYDADKDQWKILARLPYRAKSASAAYHNGYLYTACGQEDQGFDNPYPGFYLNKAWKAKFSIDDK